MEFLQPTFRLLLHMLFTAMYQLHKLPNVEYFDRKITLWTENWKWRKKSA